ncbi:MAG: hypothetical protein ACI9O0_000987 [Paracoccaceae bacterium]|jgi:hypothetical protein
MYVRIVLGRSHFRTLGWVLRLQRSPLVVCGLMDETSLNLSRVGTVLTLAADQQNDERHLQAVNLTFSTLSQH